MASSNPRRDILVLLGFSLACLAPIVVITRLRNVPPASPTPLPGALNPAGKKAAVPGSVIPIGPIAFSPDGRLLAGVLPYKGPISNGNQLATLYLWRISDGKQLRQLKVNAVSVNALKWSPDSRTIQNSGMWVERWDAATGKRLSRKLKLRPSAPKPTTKITVRKADFQKYPDMSFLRGVATFAEDIEVRRHGSQSLQVFTATSGRLLSEWELALDADHINGMTRLSPVRPTRLSSKVMLLSGKRGQRQRSLQFALQMWDVKTKRKIWQFIVPQTFLSGDFSPDGKFFVVWGWLQQQKKGRTANVAWVLDAATGKKLFEFETNDAMTTAVSFGTSGYKFVSNGQDVSGNQWIPAIRIHRVDTGKLVETLHLPPKHNSANSIDLSRDGSLLATANNYGVQVWKVRDLETKAQAAIPKLLSPSAKAPALPMQNAKLKMQKGKP